jgi:hypothetical protein
MSLSALLLGRRPDGAYPRSMLLGTPMASANVYRATGIPIGPDVATSGPGDNVTGAVPDSVIVSAGVAPRLPNTHGVAAASCTNTESDRYPHLIRSLWAADGGTAVI